MNTVKIQPPWKLYKIKIFVKMNLILEEDCKLLNFIFLNILFNIIVQEMLKVYQEKRHFQIGKHYMIMIIE